MEEAEPQTLQMDPLLQSQSVGAVLLSLLKDQIALMVVQAPRLVEPFPQPHRMVRKARLGLPLLEDLEVVRAPVMPLQLVEALVSLALLEPGAHQMEEPLEPLLWETSLQVAAAVLQDLGSLLGPLVVHQPGALARLALGEERLLPNLPRMISHPLNHQVDRVPLPPFSQLTVLNQVPPPVLPYPVGFMN